MTSARAGTPPRCTAALAATLLALTTACSPEAAPDSARPRVTVEGAHGAAAVEVEVARTPEQHQRGLMNRSRLGPDAGMLFVFAESDRHGFWMKNTLIPLDMIFIGDDGRVAAVVERKPLGLEVSDGGVASRYVLEVNGGWAASHGVKVGDRVRFERVLY